MQNFELLRSMEIFQEIADEQLAEMADHLAEHRVQAETVLFREGDAGDSMLIVTAGRIRVSSVDTAGRERTLAVYRDGEFFGETGVLTGEPRSADGTAEVDSRFLVLTKADFDRFLASNPAVMRRMARIIAQRQTQANIRLVEGEDGGAGTKAGAGRVVAIFGSRGGSGKSMIAVNLAVLLARQFPDRVALLDLSVTFSHAALFLGLSPSDGIASIDPEKLGNMDRETLNRYAIPHSSTLRVYAGAVRPEDGESISGEHVKAVLDIMKRQYLFTVVDLPSNFNEPTLAALELVDRLILVMTPDLASIRDMREVLRLFADTIRVPRPKHYFVLNQPSPTRPIGREELEKHLEIGVNAEVPHAGEAVFRAQMKGETLLQAAAGSSTLRAIERIAADISAESAVKPSAITGRPAAAKGGILGRLFGKKA